MPAFCWQYVNRIKSKAWAPCSRWHSPWLTSNPAFTLVNNIVRGHHSLSMYACDTELRFQRQRQVTWDFLNWMQIRYDLNDSSVQSYGTCGHKFGFIPPSINPIHCLMAKHGRKTKKLQQNEEKNQTTKLHIHKWQAISDTSDLFLGSVNTHEGQNT